MLAPKRKTTRSVASIDLNKMVSNDYYNAALSGHFLSTMAPIQLVKDYGGIGAIYDLSKTDFASHVSFG
jgi:hypothetical protein